MFFGALLFIAFIGCACFGAVMLIASLALCFIRRFRRHGMIMFGAGILGMCIGLSLFMALDYLLGAQPRQFNVMLVLFSISGFGFASFFAMGVLVILRFLRYPTRWVDRQKRSSL